MKRIVPSHKMMLCLPYAPHEVHQARELVRLWTDLEHEFNKDVILAIVSRFDIPANHIGQDVIDYAKSKFEVILHQCRRKGVGWPAGCNQLEVGAYEWFVESNRSNRYDIPYILFAEADTVPLRPTWLSEIVKEAYDSNASILGAYFVKEDGHPHINGNCVIHKDFWKECRPIWTISNWVGWDVAIGRVAIKIGTPSRLIWQDYRLGAPDNPWRSCDHLFEAKEFKTKSNPLYGEKLYPCLIHGIKVMTGIECVRKRLLG